MTSPVITEAYRQEQATLHSTGKYGTTGAKYGHVIEKLLRSVNATSLLDYGCGSRRSLLETLTLPPHIVYEGYDPAVPDYSDAPIPAELVCCIDVLEHIEPPLLENVLTHLSELCDPYGFFTVHTGPAVKVLSDGRNAHLIQENFPWWERRLAAHFLILDRRDILNGFVVLVRSTSVDARAGESRLRIPLAGSPGTDITTPLPQKEQGSNISQVEHLGKSLKFSTPNAMTAWRVKTLFDKEPHTIRWLESMPSGSLLFDIGANVGMYSIFAAAIRNVRVAAFEPESQNYALLNTNIAINQLAEKVSAYPLALSDRMQLHTLYLSQFSAGGSCHSFGEEVGFDLKPRTAGFTQGAFSTTIDQLIESGALPVPDFMKIDVDGFEHKVLSGCQKTLANPKVQEILVELNTHLAEHRAVVDQLYALGFKHDSAQASAALRSTGAFEGVGEFIFRRPVIPALAPPAMDRISTLHAPLSKTGRHVLNHLSEKLGSASVQLDPFPYLVIDDIFPEDYYAEMLRQFPSMGQMGPIADTGRVTKGQYNERKVILFTEEQFEKLTGEQRDFWRDFSNWMFSDLFVNAFLLKFQKALTQRLEKIIEADSLMRVKSDALLVNDQTNYAIGPHTDAPPRLVSFLFYLPDNNNLSQFGTSLYRPKDPKFVSWSGLHHEFAKFDLVKTIDFLPNRLVAFPKTAQCFHGVERISRDGVERRLIINNIRLLNEVTH